jgi:predicted MFS family arabinose efflux permease
MPHTFTRDKTFWIITLQVTILNYYLGGFGPAQPLLRADQGTSLTIAGLHGTAMGVAAICAGLSNSRWVHYFGREKTSWIGMWLFCTGVLMFVTFKSVGFTLTATFLGGMGTSMVINNMVTRLSHHFKQATPLALPQSNGINSVGFVFGTIAVGTLAGTAISWRFGLLLTIPATIILYFFSRDKNQDSHDRDVSVRQKGKLSRTYWIACFGFFICICTEFATSFWAAALLRDRVGGTASAATLAIVALGTGMAVGRWYGAIVLKKLHLDQQLITIIILQFIGFAIFWFSHTLVVSLITLFITGLGISMQFALSSLRLIGFSEKRPDLAIGISSLAAGSGIALAPFILGVLGDHLGISRAYLMVPVLILVALAIVILIPSKVGSMEEEHNELQD